jgi:cellulose synthase/poly-beta-1,6-N-acetylglucosamine synthase-like glycosyltransferase
MIDCSIGIMAYNEEQNVGVLLESLLNQKLSSVNIKEIIVVASGCTDNTIDIVKKFFKIDKRIKFLVQEKRIGKISAINCFLQMAKSDIIAIVNADILPQKNSVENLISPFEDPQIGMTGGRIVPVDNYDNLLGFAAHLLWNLHHDVSVKYPKLGEVISYRHLDGLQFPPDTVDDEGIAEAEIIRQGFKLQYIPGAIFNNFNPQRIKEFFRRRRNIYAGHLQLKKRTSYAVSTIKIMNLLKILPVSIFRITKFNPKFISWAVIIILTELLARIMGAYDFYIKNKDHRIWEIAKTSKRKFHV